MNSMKNINGKESNTAKGVNIATEFNEYKYILLHKKVIWDKMRRTHSRKHKTGAYEVNKISLLYFDDKRYILDDGIEMLAYFHKDLRKQEDVWKILTDDHK